MTTWIGTLYANPNGNQTYSNAQTQQWLTQVTLALSSAGLVQTADTGQTDPATAVTPVSSPSDGGYFIYRFNDSRQGVDPLFLKIVWGRGPSANGAGLTRLKVQVGQGTNGAGTLTGNVSPVLSTNEQASVGGGSTSSGTSNVREYACHTEGCMMLVDRFGQANWFTYAHAFSVARTRDSNGNFDGLGVNIFVADQTGHRMSSVRMASPAANYTEHTQYCIVPALPASTALLNGDKQLYPHQSNWPDVRTAWATATVRYSEIAPTIPTTFSGTTDSPHTFICFSSSGSGPRSANVTYNTAFIPCWVWE